MWEFPSAPYQRVLEIETDNCGVPQAQAPSGRKSAVSG
jgi:hypothetical protein